MISSNRFLHYFDWISFILTLSISAIGLLFILSATYIPEQPYSFFFKKQCVGLAIGLILYFACTIIDYRTLMRLCYFGYVGIIVLLLFTLLKGSIGMGAQRWINLVFFKLQPSELVKLFFPPFVAYHWFSIKEKKENSVSDFIPILIMLGISFILIRKQPDLGTALIILFTALIMLWMIGLPRRWFLYGFLIIVISAPILWQVLRTYQKNRIMVFLGYGDKHKERYQIEQATIAIGSGGFWGKGYLQGTQNKLRFLPEGRTDFIFAVLCEEWGFCGACLIILLYTLLFLRILSLIKTITDPTIQLLAIGLALPLILSAIINIYMVNGLSPVVGIPLPLMSYGLCNLWISWMSLGCVQGIMMQRSHIGEYKLIYL